MVAIKNIFLFAAAATAAVLPRDATTVLNDLKKINTDTTTLTSAINSWDGSTIGAIPIQNAESTLDSDIKSATTDAKSAGAASSADSKSIIAYIQNTLEPNIVKSLNALSSKKSQFKSSGLYNTVKSDLATLKSDSDALSSQLQTDASSDQKSAAKSIASKIDADFTSAQSSFS